MWLRNTVKICEEGDLYPPHTCWWWAAMNGRTLFTATNMCGCIPRIFQKFTRLWSRLVGWKLCCNQSLPLAKSSLKTSPCWWGPVTGLPTSRCGEDITLVKFIYLHASFIPMENTKLTGVRFQPRLKCSYKKGKSSPPNHCGTWFDEQCIC